jgi:very-short-patch-repair endonuclease
VIQKQNPPRSPLVRGEALASTPQQDSPALLGGREAFAQNSQQDSPSPDKGKAWEGLEFEEKIVTGQGGFNRGSFIPYRINLRELARQNRKNPTPAETKIWNELLRNKSLANYKFIRQKPLGSYIADFYCAELRLIIEIDGDHHAENAEYDLERTKFLNSLDLIVIRYGNSEIMRNLAGVAADLRDKISNALPQNGGDS